MASYDDFGDERIKHMEMVQAVITRLANHSFLIKGWAVTVAGVFFGFAVDSRDCQLALAAAAPTVFFWGLDTYFLRAERLFRMLFARVCSADSRIEPFYMAATAKTFVAALPDDDRKKATYLNVATSITLFPFYGGLLIVASVLAWALS